MTKLYQQKQSESNTVPQISNCQDYSSTETTVLLNKLLSIPLRGWDATFIRQLQRWRDIALRDGKEFKLNSKQQEHLNRIAAQYLGGGSHE